MAVLELETDTPRTVYGHRPLPIAITFQFVQADAGKRAKIKQGFGDVQSQKKIDGGPHVGSTKPVRPFTLPNLSAWRISP